MAERFCSFFFGLMVLEECLAYVYYDIKAEIAVLRHPLSWLFWRVGFFADAALLHCCVNVDFANIQSDNAPSFGLLREKLLAAAICWLWLCSDRWACREKIGRADLLDEPLLQDAEQFYRMESGVFFSNEWS